MAQMSDNNYDGNNTAAQLIIVLTISTQTARTEFHTGAENPFYFGVLTGVCV